jgi:hypothetical protein
VLGERIGRLAPWRGLLASIGPLTDKDAIKSEDLNAFEIALYHALGNLPTPPMTHRFC